LELVEKFGGGLVGKADVRGKDVVIEHRGAEEAAELLFFDWIARNGESMAAAGEDQAGDAAVEWGEESDAPFLEGEFEVGAAKLDLIFGLDAVDG
jgi:hypothetical protein